jgi:hypothetical protein
MSDFLGDLRYAIRLLIKQPGFTLRASRVDPSVALRVE